MIVIKTFTKCITIQEGKRTEVETIRNLIVDSYIQYKDEFESERWERYFQELITAVDNEQIDSLLVAKSKNTILGTVQLFPNGTVAYGEPTLKMNHPIIRFLAVHPKGRGLGIAKKLLDCSIEYARKKEATHISLHTTDMMKDAVKLYRKYGFERHEAYDFDKEGKVIHCYSFTL